MIIVDSLVKVLGRAPARRRVLDGVEATFEPRGRYVIFGLRGAGKSTLLRLIGGMLEPTSGRVRRYASVSLPAGVAAQLAGLRTVRQLVSLMAGLYDTDPQEIAEFTLPFAGLDELADMPVAALAAADRLRLGFALTYAIPCDFHLFDDAVTCGEGTFRRNCLQAFESRQRRSGTIVATRNVNGAAALGDRGCVLYEGRLHMCRNMADAIGLFREIELTEKAAGLAYAEALLRNGRLDEALTHLREHHAQGGGSVESYEFLASLALKLGNLVEASRASQAALARAPNSIPARLLLARSAERQGQYRAAADHAEQVLAMAPEHREAQVLLARAYGSLSMNEAAAEIWRRIAANGNEPAALRLAIRDDIKAGNWQQVLATVDLALCQFPGEAGLLEIRARALLEQRRWADARRAVVMIADVDFEKALRTIHRLTRTGDRLLVIDFLADLPLATFEANRAARTLPVLLRFLEREAAIAARENRPREAERLRAAMARIEPARREQASTVPTADVSPPDLSTAEGIVGELSALRGNRASIEAEEFARRLEAAWAAARNFAPKPDGGP